MVNSRIDTMKTLKVYDTIHRDVKAEAAKTGRSVPLMGSALLSAAIKLLKAGKLKLPEPDASAAEASSSGK